MRSLTSLIAAAAATIAFSASAFAWSSDAYMGKHDSSTSGMLVHSYKSGANYCPAGLEPVMVGGVICCGTPNAGAYIDRPGGVSHKKHTHTKTYMHSHVKKHSHTKTYSHSH